MRAFKKAVDRVVGSFLAAAMGLSVLTVLWQVASRYLLGDPSQFTDELVRYLLVWIGLLGASYAAGQRLHLAIDLLPRALEGKARQRLERCIQLAIFLFALLVLVIGGSQLVRLTLMLGQKSAALGLSLGYVYTVVPLSGLLLMFYSLVFMLDVTLDDTEEGATS